MKIGTHLFTYTKNIYTAPTTECLAQTYKQEWHLEQVILSYYYATLISISIITN